MDKFKALVHFVIQQCDEPSKLGAIRLNKILWFADREAFLITGNSISGATYVRRRMGPVPAQVLRSLDELKSEGKISVTEPMDRYMPRKFESLVDVNLELFSEFEKEIVKTVTNSICNNFTADEISELSHDDVWEAAGEGEEIPLEATLIATSGDFRVPVLLWADEVVDKHSGVEISH